jgi:hypothetical protein
LLALAGLAGGYTLWRFSAPSLHGVVLDAATGQPIAGAMVARKVFRAAQVSLTESTGVFTEPRSLVETQTDSTGRFRLPGFVSLVPIGILGESGMAWKVFSQEHMVAGGCESEGFPAAYGCGAESPFYYTYPWDTATSRRRFGSIRLEVRVSPPPPGSTDFWGEYFRRLNLLAQDRYITLGRFAEEAVRYLGWHPLSERMVDPFAELADRLPYGREYDVVARAVVEYCNATPTSVACHHVGPSYLIVQYSRRAAPR